MLRRARWCQPIALTVALSACQAPPLPLPASPAEPAPAAGPAPEALYQVFALGDMAIVATTVDSALAGQPKERLADGDAATAWTNGGYKNPTAWATLQLGAAAPIGAVRLKTGPLSAGTTYDVQVSADGTTWTTALADQTNTTWNMETKALPAGTAGRYVRLWFKNAGMAHVSLFEVSLQSPGATPAWSPGKGWFGEYPADGGGGSFGGAPFGGDYRRYWPDLLAIAPSSFYVDGRTAGKRFLRFPTAIGNAGNGHLQVRGKVVGDVTQATQEILDDDGRVVETKDVGTFELHPNHGHFHVSHVARYELRRGDHEGELVQNGKKISFCMEDSIKIREGAGDARIPECSPTMQGITRGYADVYSANLPEQTFDVEDLASGEYTIVIQLDPGRKFLETNRNNNLAWVRFRYDAAAGKAYRIAAYP